MASSFTSSIIRSQSEETALRIFISMILIRVCLLVGKVDS
jgi:hypothetical protein